MTNEVPKEKATSARPDEVGKSAAEAVVKSSAPAPLPKRFYKIVSVEEREGGKFAILLDGRAVKTPGKVPLLLASKPMAKAIATEWDAQEIHIDTMAMPLTRLAYGAIDGITGREKQVRAEIVKYAGNDLLCYRATHPAELVARQSAAWDPVLEWATDEFGAPFEVATGIMPVQQPDAAIGAVTATLSDMKPFHLAPLQSITSLTGSALLAIAHARGALSLDEIWSAAHIEEDWQIERWGADDEAQTRRANRKAELDAAGAFLAMV